VEETNERSPVLGGTKSKTWETTVDRVESWPEEARPLKKRNWVAYIYAIGDLILVLLPVYFIRRLSKFVHQRQLLKYVSHGYRGYSIERKTDRAQ
jgi:hypothetical protein